MSDDFAHKFRSARSVMHRDTHLEVTGIIGALIETLAECAQPAGKRGVFAREAGTGAKIGEVKNEIVNRVGLILERGRDCEPFAALEETEDDPAAGGVSVRLDQSKTSPGEGRGGDDLDGLIVLQLGAIAANQRERRTFGRIEDGFA